MVLNASNSSFCYVFQNTSNTSSGTLPEDLHNILTYPAVIVLVLTLLLSSIILVALIVARFQNSSTSMLYFNLTVTDILMALAGIFIMLLPYNNSFLLYQRISFIIQDLRYNWQLTVVILMFNRYRIVRAKPGFSVTSTKLLIAGAWMLSGLNATTFYLLSDGGPWESLNKTLAGAFLNNILTCSSIVPTATVLVLLLMVFCKARSQIRQIAQYEQLVRDIHDTDSLQTDSMVDGMEQGLKLLYAFGVIYLVGFGYEALLSAYNLVNLSGYAQVLPSPYSAQFCVYTLIADEICNLVLNLSNSMIIVQSKQIQSAFKTIHRATSRLVLRGSTEAVYDGITF